MDFKGQEVVKEAIKETSAKEVCASNSLHNFIFQDKTLIRLIPLDTSNVLKHKKTIAATL